MACKHGIRPNGGTGGGGGGCADFNDTPPFPGGHGLGGFGSRSVAGRLLRCGCLNILANQTADLIAKRFVLKRLRSM